VLATYPVAGDGLECPIDAPDDCGVPRNAVLQIRLDRYLLPATAIRQSIKFYSGTEEVSPFTQPEYDVVERVLLYRPRGNELPPETTYTVEILIPEGDSDGLRAFDGAPLETGSVPLNFDFRTEALPAGPEPYPIETASCADVLGIVGPTCSTGVCHGTGGGGSCPIGTGPDSEGRCVAVPRMGLSLDSALGLKLTAIDKVAHQTDLGSKGLATQEDSSRFGVAMPIIDPKRPDNSYLLYKLLRRVENFDTADNNPANGVAGICETRYQVGFETGGPCIPPSEDESLRLREWFVRGDPMPAGAVPETGLPLKQLQRSELRTIQAWIGNGAQCP
jgi:hypothetical protein